MHDRKGNLLKEGDEVMVPCVIKTLSEATPEYCNISLETVEPMYPGESKSFITLNAKQVEKLTGE